MPRTSELITPLVIEKKCDQSTFEDWTEESEEWKACGNILAKVVAKSGGERLANTNILSVDQYEIVTHNRADITSQHRLRDIPRGYVYNISRVDSEGQWMSITAVRENG